VRRSERAALKMKTPHRGVATTFVRRLRYFINERDACFEAIATGAGAKFLACWEQRDRNS
jgi:hypothetical protein